MRAGRALGGLLGHVIALLLCACLVAAHGHHGHAKPASELQAMYCSCPTPPPPTHISSCEFVTRLSAEKAASKGVLPDGAHGHRPGHRQRALFAFIFPFENPGANALLSTFYISSFPNFLLWFIPAEMDPSTLNTMVAFATGGLLGDVFLHLLPETFLSSPTTTSSPAHAAVFIMVDEKRNVVLGCAIFLGFAVFFLMEKIMRVLNAGSEGGGHSHSHSHAHHHEHKSIEGKSSAVETSLAGDALVQRKGAVRSAAAEGEVVTDKKEAKREISASVKLAAYLNLFADAAHNCTDGIAIAASFYASPAIGATTTVAVFFHEIPHEMADFSILLKSGFTKREAMTSQFITALGAFLGTFIGILLHATTSGSSAASVTDESTLLISAIHNSAAGLFGTSADLAACVIPFTAGGFLYIATAGVVPGLLEETKSVKEGGLKQTVREWTAMAVGVGCMTALAWNE